MMQAVCHCGNFSDVPTVAHVLNFIYWDALVTGVAALAEAVSDKPANKAIPEMLKLTGPKHQFVQNSRLMRWLPVQPV